MTDILKDLVAELVTYRSTADQQEELKRVLDVVIDTIHELAPTLTVEHFNRANKPSILVYKGNVRPERFKIILNGHLDVVPGTDAQFKLETRKDHLYGRGTLDMKAAAAVMVQVFCELAPTLDYAAGLQVVTDEEIGGRNGTKHQIEQGVATELAICGEFTPPAEICNESRGICQFRVRFEGKTAHSAYPWNGENAIVAANQYIAKLLEQYPIPSSKVWETTVNISTITTTNKTINQVPDTANVEIDIRYIPGDAHFESRQNALDFLQEIDDQAIIEILMFEPSHYADSKNTYIEQLARVVSEEWNTETKFIQKPGAADGRFYSEMGMPAVIFGPQGEGLHGDDEYVEIASLERYRRILTKFLQVL